MATIRLQRTSEYINRFRDYRIFIDEQQVGTIANGETKYFATNEGQHTIAAKIDWCSSPNISFDIKGNQTKRLKLGGFKNAQRLIPITLGLLVLCSILSKFVNFGYTLLLAAPVFILLFFYLTIGRKKYLTLTELNDNSQ